MQSLCNKIMQSLCNKIMQSLCNMIMQRLCWHITCSWTTVAADEFLGPTPPPLRPVVVVGTPNSTVPFGPVSAFSGPVLFEPDPGLGLTVSMQPLHKLALHNVSQRDGVAASHPNKNLVELAICVRILEVLVMSLLLLRNPLPARQRLS